MMVRTRRLVAGFLHAASLLIFSEVPLLAKVIYVPRDFPTIGAAVSASQAGDEVEVGDGIYVEENIVLDKNIRLRAERPHGAIIYSIGEKQVPVFVVRARVEIRGFVIKNCYTGIMQRGSPEVEWFGRDLIFQNISGSAITINDVSANIGMAFLNNIIVERADSAFSTNDANGIYLRNALVSDCNTVLYGFDHIFFDVDRIIFSNCEGLSDNPGHSPPPPATNEIRLGPNILDLDTAFQNSHRGGDSRLLFFEGFFGSSDSEAAKEGGFRVGEGFLMNLLGRACLNSGDYAKAGDYFRGALNIGSRIRFDEVVFQAKHGLAQTEHMLGRPLQALAHYSETVALVDDMSRKLPLRVYNEGFLRDKLEVFEGAISLLVELQADNPGADYGRRAFVLAERLKTLGFYDSLLEYRYELNQGQDPDLRTKVRDAARKISSLHVLLQDESLAAAERDSKLLELESTENVYKSLMVQLRNRESQAAGFVDQPPIGFDDARKHFPGKNVAVLEYVVRKEHVFGFLLTGAGVMVTILGDTDLVRQITSDYLKFLSLRSEGDFKAIKGGMKLGKLLLHPFKDKLGRDTKSLIIIPDGFLFGLPFGALIWEEPETNSSATFPARPPAEFLAERFAISYAPSVSSLLSIKKRHNSESRDMDLLAVVDSREKSFRGLETSRQYRFPRLNSVNDEVEAVIRLFQPGKRLVLKDSRVSEESFKGLSLGRFQIIHIATHGYYDDADWARSGLLLGRREESTEDGVLRPIDLYDVHLNSDLVVLSACQTAKGRPGEGMGLLGLSLSFLAAGSRAVLSSLWNIDDKSTTLFMGRFYRYLSEKRTVSEALRSAKIDMIRSKDRSHPFFWAAFVLIGDGDTVLGYQYR